MCFSYKPDQTFRFPENKMFIITDMRNSDYFLCSVVVVGEFDRIYFYRIAVFSGVMI